MLTRFDNERAVSMCKSNARTLCRVVPLILLCAAAAEAQTLGDGLIEGTVRDATGSVVSNANVSVSSGSLIGGPQLTRTNTSGVYRVLALPPATYEVAVQADGFSPQRRTGLVLAPGRALTADVVLIVAPLQQQTEVVAEPVAADIRSTSISLVLGQTMLENLPLTRDASSLINLAPGVKDFAALGGAVLGNPMQIDGMNANEANTRTPAIHPNLYWISQAQMVGAGADARYGDYTGLSMNLVTRSGTDTVSGLGQYQAARNNWISNNRGDLAADLKRQFRPLELLKRWDGFGQVGGPIRRQRVWYFAGVEAYRDDIRPATFSELPRTPDEPSADTSENNFTAKVNASLSAFLRLEGLFQQIHRNVSNFNAGPLVAPEALANDDRFERLANVSVTWTPNGRTLIEARGGVNSIHEDAGPSSDRRDGPPGHLDALTGVRTVNATGFNDRYSRISSAAASLTRFSTDFLGRGHQFVFGAQFERTTATVETGYPGGLFYYDLGGAPYMAFEWAGATKRPTGYTTTLYAQDIWSLGSRLTITPGVRVAFDSGAVEQMGHVLSATTISPRAGLAWDVTGTHHTIVRAHYGHYHEAFATNLFEFMDPRASAPVIAALVTAPGSLQPTTTFGSNDQYAIDPGFDMPYVREFAASAEYARSPGASISFQWVRRDFESIAAMTRPDAVWTPFQFVDPGPDGRAGTPDDGALLTASALQNPGPARWILTNPAEAYHSYDGLQAIGRARIHGVDVHASWAWSRTLANFRNGFRSNVAGDDAGINATFANPNRLVNAGGRTIFDVPLDVKVLATWATDRWTSLRLSGVYTLQSGHLSGRTVVARSGQGAQIVAAEPPTYRSPNRNTLDIRLDKPLMIRGSTRLHALLDVFNVWNQGISTSLVPVAGPNFGRPGAWSDPRTVRAGARVTF